MDFNKYKHFINEVVSNSRDIHNKYVEQKSLTGNNDDSVEF